MNVTGNSDSTTSSTAILTRVDALLEHAEQLARTPITPSDFHQHVLGELSDILQSAGIAVWTIRDSSLSLAFDTVAEQRDLWATSGRELISRLDSDRTLLVPPGVGGRWPNSTEFARCVTCLTVAPMLRLAVDVRLPATAQRGDNIGDMVAAVTASLVEFHRSQFLGRMLAVNSQRDRLAAVCLALHTTLDRHRIALEVANDGATALKLDRVSVMLAIRPGGALRLAAATGVSELNQRANAGRALEQLVANLRASQLTLPWTSRQTPANEGASRAAGEIANRYLQESGSRRVRVEPLGPCENPWDGALGAVVFEHFGDDLPSTEFDAIPELCRHASAAIGNALNCESRGIMGRLRRARLLASARPVQIVVGTLLMAIVLLTIIPANFTLEAHGQVQPVQRRNIFAPADGIISQITAHHRQTVTVGDPLLSLRSPELDLEEQRIRGEISTATARLASVRAARVDQDRRHAASATTGQLTAEEEELKQTIANLNRQLEIVEGRLAELVVRSPIAGQVMRWDLIQVLESRPVRQGQLLLQVINPDEPWQLELRIPDRSVRHVLAAQKSAPEPLPVQFLFRMAPGQTYSAKLESINLATDLDHNGELSTLATVPIPARDIPDLRPGSGVVARIHCGRRSLGFVWLRELWEFIQTRVLF